jgi:hypothetical protein
MPRFVDHGNGAHVSEQFENAPCFLVIYAFSRVSKSQCAKFDRHFGCSAWQGQYGSMSYRSLKSASEMSVDDIQLLWKIIFDKQAADR